MSMTILTVSLLFNVTIKSALLRSAQQYEIIIGFNFIWYLILSVI